MRLAVIGAALAAVVIADSATTDQTRHNKTPKEAIRNRASNRGPSEGS